MVQIDAKTVMQLRKQTGAPMMDCKEALEEAQGDMANAVDILRKKGLKAAEGRMGREAAEGLIFSYVHNGKIGVLVDVACETDFVARNEEFRTFGKDLTHHITASAPRWLDRSQVDEAVLAKEREIAEAQAAEQMAGKPKDVVAKAVEGKIAKWLADVCLLEQPWVKDPSLTVETVVKTLGGKIGENIHIRRFVRIELGG